MGMPSANSDGRLLSRLEERVDAVLVRQDRMELQIHTRLDKSDSEISRRLDRLDARLQVESPETRLGALETAVAEFKIMFEQLAKDQETLKKKNMVADVAGSVAAAVVATAASIAAIFGLRQ
jgi:hypothetical protein